MENEELRELKRELNKEINGLKREYKSFKRRISTIANLFIPGIGFMTHTHFDRHEELVLY